MTLLASFHKLVLTVAALVVCAAPSRSSQPSQQEPVTPTFSARADLVVVRVSVTDRRSGWLSGLGREAFTIYDNGVQQEIAFFSNEDIPVTVGLVVDSSGSMGPKRDLVRTGAMQFAQSSNPKDEMFVVAFNERVRFGLPPSTLFTSDLDLVRQALAVTGARGKTALYDAIDTALSRLETGSRDQRVLVVLSDGSDNASTIALEALLKRIESLDVVVYTVGLFARSDPDANPEVLDQLARSSGGSRYLPDDVKEVSDILERIARDIRHSYTIGYAPTVQETAEADPYRRVQVLVRAPNRNRLSVRHREGYRAGGSTNRSAAEDRP